MAVAINTTNSMVASTPRKAEKISASRFYGVWKDEDFDMSSDELVKEIKDSRCFK